MKIGLSNSGCKGLKKVTLFASAYFSGREAMQFTYDLGSDTRICIEKYSVRRRQVLVIKR